MPHLILPIDFQKANVAFMFAGVVLQLINLRYGYFRVSARQQNIITALFDYDDSPLVADPLCRALSYYNGGNKNETSKSSKEALLKRYLISRKTLLKHILRVLPLSPDDKNALTKDARVALRNGLIALETAYTANLSPEMQSSRTFDADFQIAVVRHFARTCDRDALPALRKLAKVQPFSDDGRRVQDAARTALLAFENPAA